jgi:Tol biopolymer transport system component
MTQTPARLPHLVRGVGIIFFIGFVILAIPLFLNPAPVKAQSVMVGRLYLLSKTSGGTIGNNQSYQPDVSSDGRLVVFATDADNLVGGDDNGRADIAVLDRTLNQIELVSLQSDGDQSNDSSFEPAISGDGRWVVFCSFANNLVNGDTNNRPDTFLYDRQQNEIRRISEANNNDNGNANSCGRADLSANGEVVVFISDASNLVLSDTNNVRDVFVYTRSDDTVRRINAAGGAQPNAVSDSPSISADGRYIAFQSDATNFVSGDDNGKTDIYIYDRADNDIEIASQRQDGGDGTGTATFPTISGDARFVVFQGTDGNLIANDNNGKTDIFLHVRDGI